MKDQYLFVYGTLRRAAGHAMARLLARAADLVGDATFQGKLYRIGDYPGVVPSTNPSDTVHGELFRLREPGLVLSRLDQYEGCGPGFPEPAEYRRVRQPVRLGNGVIVAAWVYLYNRPTANLEPIPSGDFFKCHAD